MRAHNVQLRATHRVHALMRLLLSLAAAALVLVTSTPIAHAAPDEPSAGESPPGGAIVAATRQNAFTIPFRIEAAQDPAQQPVEVQLHVSTNEGRSWEPAGRVKPEKNSFVFRAPHDGEYWYSIRTLDKQGVARPEGPLSPQLKVSVDTVAPRLDLTAFRGEGGEIVAHWQAVDPHLKPDSFKLDYQATSSGPWEPVAVDAAPQAMRHTLSGEATWWTKSTETIVVRAEITDLAGNPVVSQAVVKPGDIGPANDLARGEAAQRPRSTTDTAPSTRWPADRSTSGPLTRSTNPDARAGDSSNRDPQGGDLSSRDPNWRRSTAGPRERMSAQSVSQPHRAGRGNLDFSLLPVGERPRLVNSRSFELEYEIESVGPSGVAKVELWGTRDGGRTWSVFGVDTDNRSPQPVTVDAEGVYGFRVIVQSGSGLGGRPPAAGDAPDIWIAVDLTRPACRITAADINDETGELVIRWEASDEAPDARPIALLCGAGPQGPWTPIASGLENTGTYRWRLDGRAPERVYLRLEVRDEAGNVGIFETAEPVSLDRHRPEGRIRGVRPLGQ